MYKTCTKCLSLKSKDDFHKDKTSKDGYCYHCKACVKANHEANKDRISAKKREYENANRDRLRAVSRKYYWDNREARMVKDKEYKKANRDYILERSRKAYADNREARIAAAKRYMANNKEMVLAKKKRYREKNKEKIAAHKKEYLRKYAEKHGAGYDSVRRNKDPVLRAKHNIRRRIRAILSAKGVMKTSSTSKILGISLEGFVQHIESQFLEGMSWENMTEWHVDHVKPLTMGNTVEEIHILNHYTNLRPIWKEDNLSKGGRYTEEDEKWLKELAELL